MSSSRAHTATLNGGTDAIVGIDVQLVTATPSGAPQDQQVPGSRETCDRVRSALRNSGLTWPTDWVDFRASHWPDAAGDLALAVAVLAASGAVPTAPLARTVFLGELSLDGGIRPVRGLAARLRAARAHGTHLVIVPEDSLAEAIHVQGVQVLGAHRVAEVAAWLTGHGALASPLTEPDTVPSRTVDLAVNPLNAPAVQDDVLAAMEIAAAGGHHTLLVGRPAAGPLMLAHSLHHLLPPLRRHHADQLAAIRALADPPTATTSATAPPESTPPVAAAPFVAPRHRGSLVALVGGGRPARPGALSLAHAGLLLLEDPWSLGPARLAALAAVLEQDTVRLGRDPHGIAYPAQCQLLLATGPCPCTAGTEDRCTCSPLTRRRHLTRLPRLLLDRIDLRIHLTDTPPSTRGRASAAARERVHAARARAAQRWRPYGVHTNARAPERALHTDLALPAATTRPLHRAAGTLSRRAVTGCLRLAWTLADLEDADQPSVWHVATALDYRTA